MGKTKYIFSTGELKRRENSISFRDTSGRLTHMPIETIREIYLMNEVSINTKLIQILNTAGIQVHFFDYYGHYIGSYYPKEYLLSGRLTVQQALAYSDERRLYIAKRIVETIAESIMSLLYHYYRHGKSEVKEAIDYCDHVKELLSHTKDVRQVMAIEGRIWSLFYDSFRFFLNESFVFSKRVRRPPDNPMNALISFLNSMLYTKTITMLYHTHLDQTISFLHEPSEARFSLSLDIAEIFKADIVFKTIFDLVNRRQIKVDKHFESKVNYCILNEAGRKLVIKAFEERLGATFEHAGLHRKITYETAIKFEGYKLIKYLTEGVDYKPFTSERKC